MMKSIYFLILILSSLKLTSQIDSTIANYTPTSDEEYNYMTKGYKIQVGSGLDMKKGYHFEDVGDHQIGTYRFMIKNLIRESGNELAGTLITTYSSSSGTTYYNGIPVNNPKLMDQYADDISKWRGPLLAAYCNLVSAYAASFFTDYHLSHSKKE